MGLPDAPPDPFGQFLGEERTRRDAQRGADVGLPDDVRNTLNAAYVDGKLKVTLRAEDAINENRHMKVKLTVPKKWKAGPVAKLLIFSVDTWNAKHADLAPLAVDDFHLSVNDQPLGLEDIIQDVLRPSDEVFIKEGKAPFHGKVAKRSYANVQQLEEALKHTPQAKHNAHQKECYDAASTFYARSPLRPDVAETLDRLAERIVERAGRNRGDEYALRIFDAGCGAGHLTRKLAALTSEKRSVQVVAVDLSPKTIEHCLKNKPANVRFECGDVSDYPGRFLAIGEGVTFDVVVFHATLQHVFDPKKAFAAASNLLRGGGAVFVAQAQGRAHSDSLGDKDAKLQPRGLPKTAEDFEELLPEKSMLELVSFEDKVPYVVELTSTKTYEEAVAFKDQMDSEDPLGNYLRKRGTTPGDWREKMKDTAPGVVFGPARPPPAPARKKQS
jgi:SAM-dependent methyltransferase